MNLIHHKSRFNFTTHTKAPFNHISDEELNKWLNDLKTRMDADPECDYTYTASGDSAVVGFKMDDENGGDEYVFFVMNNYAQITIPGKKIKTKDEPESILPSVI